METDFDPTETKTYQTVEDLWSLTRKYPKLSLTEDAVKKIYNLFLNDFKLATINNKIKMVWEERESDIVYAIMIKVARMCDTPEAASTLAANLGMDRSVLMSIAKAEPAFFAKLTPLVWHQHLPNRVRAYLRKNGFER